MVTGTHVLHPYTCKLCVCKIMRVVSAVAQSVERAASGHEVPDSNPPVAASFPLGCVGVRPLSSVSFGCYDTRVINWDCYLAAAILLCYAPRLISLGPTSYCYLCLLTLSPSHQQKS